MTYTYTIKYINEAESALWAPTVFRNTSGIAAPSASVPTGRDSAHYDR